MPRIPTYTLAWSPLQTTYELYATRGREALPIVPDSPDWSTWLDGISSFAFRGKNGHYTACKEAKQRGKGYWYAYLTKDGRLNKKYVGKTSDVTLARLEFVAEILCSQSISEAPFPPYSEPSPTRNFPDPLLELKTHAPYLRTRLVSRDHLIERLQEGMECPLTLVSAPAGFGKTTLLAQWLRESGMPVAWLSLEPEDNDLTRFLSSLIAALQTLNPHVGATVLASLHTPTPPPPETILAVLVNELNELGEQEGREMALVLDDYHVITAEPLQRGMALFLEHLPPYLHLILATRVDPPLPLARLRARKQLSEVRAADLRFDSDEVHTFLQTVMGLELSIEAMATLESRTEGWVAGLQLAALSLQGNRDVAGFLADFAGTHRFVLDYLSEEVFALQPPQVQAFLLHTSILDRLSGPLCDSVTRQEGSQAMLEKLEKANLFVIALDEVRGWYRYHQLFADMLRHYLQQREPAMVAELHRRASGWYEEHDLPIEAVQHALAIPDAELAARLIEPVAFPLAFRSQLTTAFTWIKALPETVVHTHPLLCVYFAVLLLFTNQFEEVEIYLRKAEQNLKEETPVEQIRIIQGYMLAIRATMANFSGETEHAISLAHLALDLLPETEYIPHSGALQITAHAYSISGDVTLASQRSVEKTVALLRSANNSFATVSGIASLARMYVLQGKLRQAATTYEQIMHVIPSPEILQTLYIGHYYYFGLGYLFREWNDLEAAERHLMQGMALTNENSPLSARVAMMGYTALARLQQSIGNASAARATLDALVQLAQERHFAVSLFTQEAAERARLELAQNNLAAALSWAETCGISLSDVHLSYSHEHEYLTLARVRIAQARKAPKAFSLQEIMRLLEQMLGEAESKGRLGSALEILIVRALALQSQGDQTSALSVLEQALLLAEPEGYIRIFVDEGPPMRTLLHLAQARGIAPGYSATLLRAFGEQHVLKAPPRSIRLSPLTEPLTEREREVLHLLLEGASNREIACRLILSENTVKRHVSNLCGKLGVQSRLQAITRARSLNFV